MAFCDLIAHFFLVLNNISLSECTTVYLSIHTTFLQLQVKLLSTSVCKFLCGHKFTTPLGSIPRSVISTSY